MLMFKFMRGRIVRIYVLCVNVTKLSVLCSLAPEYVIAKPDSDLSWQIVLKPAGAW